MYALASALAMLADSTASGDSNFTSTSRLLRIGETVRLLRKRSIVRDWVFVSSGNGGSARLVDSNHPETSAAGIAIILLAVRASFCLGLSQGCSQSFSASRVRRASA